MPKPAKKFAKAPSAPAAKTAGRPKPTALRSGRRIDAIGRIRNLIRELNLQAGDRLPSERQLAERFDISRGTMREALQFLAALGQIETRHGGGCFVRATTTDPEFLRKWWIDWVGRHRSQVLETIEVRLACETFAAELAARRAGPAELAQLVEALRIMRGALLSQDPTQFVQSDFAFHDALLNATSNSALRNLVTTMGKGLVPNRAALLNLPGRMEKSFAEHSAIYTAVQAGDVAGAALAMRQHLESVRHDIMIYLLNDQNVTPSDRPETPGTVTSP